MTYRGEAMDLEEILERLKAESDPDSLAGMARVGISTVDAFAVKVPILRAIAREAGTDHDLAAELWKHGWRETRILAGMIDDPKVVTEEQMDSWVSKFRDWEVCDQACMNLFEKTPYRYSKAIEWSASDEEFVKRAGYVMMARLAVGKKGVDDEGLAAFLPLIVKGADDERNMVKKGVNWALRQIGKRNLFLNELAIETGVEIAAMDSKASKWIASDALRELRSAEVQRRLSERARRIRKD